MPEKTNKRKQSNKPRLTRFQSDSHADALTEDSRGPLDLYWS